MCGLEVGGAVGWGVKGMIGGAWVVGWGGAALRHPLHQHTALASAHCPCVCAQLLRLRTPLSPTPTSSPASLLTPPRQVTAFDGPSTQSDPMVVDSSTPGADGAAPAAGSGSSASSSGSPCGAPSSEGSTSSNSGCREVPTPDGYSCQQQKEWGKCGQDFIKTNGYCKCTCGDGSSDGGQQQQQQAGGGRRMLRQRR